MRKYQQHCNHFSDDRLQISNNLNSHWTETTRKVYFVGNRKFFQKYAYFCLAIVFCASSGTQTNVFRFLRGMGLPRFPTKNVYNIGLSASREMILNNLYQNSFPFKKCECIIIIITNDIASKRIIWRKEGKCFFFIFCLFVCLFVCTTPGSENINILLWAISIEIRRPVVQKMWPLFFRLQNA